MDPEQGIDEAAFVHASTILLYYAHYFKYVCGEPIVPTYQNIVERLITLNGTKSADQTWSEEDLEEVLHSLSRSYIPKSYSKVRKLELHSLMWCQEWEIKIIGQLVSGP